MDSHGRLLAVDNSPAQSQPDQPVAYAQIWETDALAALDSSHLGPFGRILLDAPCSGLGTVGCRPDLRWRRGPHDPPRLAALQLALCEKAADMLAPDGSLL